MPIYEYHCRDCRRTLSLLVRSVTTAAQPVCPRCGGSKLTRLMSRFATVKSEEARLDAIADTAGLGDLDENDPRSVTRFMKKMGSEFGDELGDDFDAALDEAMDEGEASGAEDAGDASDSSDSSGGDE